MLGLKPELGLLAEPRKRPRLASSLGATGDLRIMLLILALANVRCALYRGYPDRYSGLSKKDELASVRKNFDEAKVSACETQKTKDCRASIVNSIVEAVNIQFDAFRKEIYASGASLSSVSDMTVIGLSTAGALVGATATKTVLSAVSAAVTGARASLDRDLLYQKSTEALITRMEALRASRLVLIRGSLTKDWSEYPLSAALVDIEAYYEAGSIGAALSSINGESGESKTKSEKGLKALAGATTADDVKRVLQQ